MKAATGHNLRAFTLVELMISLVLMLVLMLGVNYIFTSVGSATGAAQTISKITRDSQAAQTMLFSDFANVALDDGPFFLISSQIQPAFRNKQAQLSAVDANVPLKVDDGAGIYTQSSAIYNERNHRTDIISFFARGNFPRQTGNDGFYVADQSSSEACIWYGHLRLADNSGSTSYSAYKRMGAESEQTNPNNFYASQWALGRVAMLLVEPDAAGEIRVNNVSQDFIERVSTPTSNTDADPLTLAPLAQGSRSKLTSSHIAYSRTDLTGIGMGRFKTILTNYIEKPAFQTEPWWDRMMLNDTDSDQFVAATRRFQADPLLRGPLDSRAMSQRAPIFLEHCSQFIVEYAGDFLDQDDNNNGNILAYTPDGTIDYIVVPAVPPQLPTRRIRWYGMPRDVANPNGLGADGIIRGTGQPNDLVDVIPLRDVLNSVGLLSTVASYTPPLKFIEKAWPTPAPAPDYMAPNVMPSDYINGSYRVAWGPDTTNQPLPTMVRITIVLDDPNGRVQEPPTFEYVLRLR